MPCDPLYPFQATLFPGRHLRVLVASKEPVLRPDFPLPPLALRQPRSGAWKFLFHRALFRNNVTSAAVLREEPEQWSSQHALRRPDEVRRHDSVCKFQNIGHSWEHQLVRGTTNEGIMDAYGHYRRSYLGDTVPRIVVVPGAHVPINKR
jgi:hypothetical protein